MASAHTKTRLKQSIANASMSALLTDEERADALDIANLIATNSQKNSKDIEATVKKLRKAGYEATTIGCGCNFYYQGYCNDETRIGILLEDGKLMVFWKDGTLEGVEMNDEDVRVVEQAWSILSNYDGVGGKDKTLEWKLERLRETGLDASISEAELADIDLKLPSSKRTLSINESGRVSPMNLRA
jgi:hypothetical protein